MQSCNHNHAQNVRAWHQSEAELAPVNMADSMEEENVAEKKRRKRHVCCAVLRYISYATFSQILEVFGTSIASGSRNSPTTDILHTVRHVYRSVWPAREAKPRFGAALVHSAHDCETRLLKVENFQIKGAVSATPLLLFTTEDAIN